jgi:trk system potassium uptake protein TrkH
MINYRIIARAFSQVLIAEGLFMLASAGVSSIYGEHAARSFIFSALITIVTGVLVFTPLRNEERVYGTREGFVINTGIWLIFGVFGTLPYLFTGSVDSFTDAFFESVSGFTTTGASIMDNVESLPHGVLFWRSITQWIGGIATISLSLYVLPIVKTLNIQLSTNEFSGLRTDKIHPKIIEATKRLVFIFVGLTFAEALLLIIGKMPPFDAVCHSFSTLSTGGFSTRNNGIAAFPSSYIRIIFIIFMFLAGTNLSLTYFATIRNFKKIRGNNEFVFYVVVSLVFSLVVSMLLFFKSGTSLFRSVIDGFFHVISIITTTGYYTENYNQWTGLLIIIVFALMFTGGMAGSASGGIKTIRLLTIIRNNRNETRRLIHPSGYLPVRIDNKSIPQNIISNILIFIALYFMILCAGAAGISFMNKDIITSFSTAASMLGNIGPGIGTFGPFSNYSGLPDTGKWFLCGLMLVGRIELLSVIVLFTRSFYRK